MRISQFFKLWNKDDEVQKLPLSFLNWLKQNKDILKVHDRSELTFVTEAVAFDIVPPVSPEICTYISVNYPYTDERKATVKVLMDKYSSYLKKEFGIEHPGDYIHWANAPIINFDSQTA